MFEFCAKVNKNFYYLALRVIILKKNKRPTPIPSLNGGEYSKGFLRFLYSPIRDGEFI